MKAVFCLLSAACAQDPHPIPNVTGSFCDDNVDFQLDASGQPLGSNFTYRLCMDVAEAANRMECTAGEKCPGGPDLALSVFTNGTLYSVDHSGVCTAKPCPQCAPPALPFSFLLIDGADGDTSRGVATYQGKTEIDGEMMDHFSHGSFDKRVLLKFLMLLLRLFSSIFLYA
jgi:hypothetical protein